MPPDKSPASPVRRLRVLVVEDETMVGLLLEGMLEELGHEVVGPIANLAKALKMAEQESFDLALLDVNIKGQDSYPVAEVLAARKIPFAFSTGYELMRLREAYRKAPTIQKPFRLSDLEKVINKLAPDRDRAVPRGSTSRPLAPRKGAGRRKRV